VLYFPFPETSPFSGLDARRDAGSLRASVVTHLTRGLSLKIVNPIGMGGLDDLLRSEQRTRRTIEDLKSLDLGEVPVHQTDYGIPEDVQQLLARIRTDLDCFHQLEAYALFTSGYLMATSAFADTAALRHPRRAGKVHWRMGAVLNQLATYGPRYVVALDVLSASRARFFKVARIRKKHALVVCAVALAALAGAVWIAGPLITRVMPGPRVVLGVVAALLAAAAVDAAVRAVTFTNQKRWTFGWRLAGERFAQLVMGWMLPLAFLWSRVQLTFVDPQYLKIGAVDSPDGRPLTRHEKPTLSRSWGLGSNGTESAVKDTILGPPE
jgi:hypothetical protein